MRKTRVLVIDDSMVFREVLARGISSDPDIEVVSTAKDPYDARDKIIKYRPDVLTCDIEMPKMNGIEFVKRLLPQYPIPVIMVTTVSEAVFDAMDAGVVDFVVKPDVRSARGVKDFLEDIIAKIKIASGAKVLKPKGNVHPQRGHSGDEFSQKGGIIAIGASTGGTEAICSILKSLPNTLPGIVVVQHIPPVFSKMFADRLDGCTPFRAKEAQNGDYVEQGEVLVAPGNMHMKVRRIGDRYKISCFEGEKVNGHCPSVDVLFESVAREAGNKAVGVILTGMGYDGAKGMLSMKRRGAKTLGQDEKSSVVYGMPKVAFELGAVERQVTLDDMPKVLCALFAKE